MNSHDLEEAETILAEMMTALQATVPTIVGLSGALFRYAVGDLQEQAPTLLKTSTLAPALLNCFTLALAAGATLVDMDNVRATMEAQTPTGIPGALVANAGTRHALIAEAQILAATTFTSSQDALAALDAISVAFDSAQIYAADNHDPANYQALIALQAKVVKDLTTRAAQLPRLVTYTQARILTSHALANRLYGDASRCDELRAENKIIHPAFCPLSGTALSQ